ncbi:hypothetical protein DFJ74DRAFT_663910 [Hyaloraphidium curvatum]|nr:hypothetical protein DFJ74DRAFT_663910 [Hyaloraphidium curvatum]
MPPVTILPNRLRLLTLPKSSLPGVTHALLRSFFFAESSALFSFTENALEISIVADLETVAHFDLSAPGLRVSADVFRALQIDNEEGLDNAGRRINELSGPLAHAGISIFYLSTYQTDLVFVKEKRLPLVLRALSDWTFTDVPSSERLDAEGGHGGHPPHPVRKLSAVGHHPTSNGGSLRSPKSLSPPIPIPVGMTHAASGGMTSVASQSPASSLTEGYFNLGSSFSPTFDMAPVRLTQMSQEESERMINEVRRLTKRSVLGRTLRLCGLNRDYMEAWALKLLRLVLYPDLVPNHENAQDRFFSYTSFDEGISLVADEAVLASTFEDHHINVSPRKLSCIQVDLDQFGLGKHRSPRAVGQARFSLSSVLQTASALCFPCPTPSRSTPSTYSTCRRTGRPTSSCLPRICRGRCQSLRSCRRLPCATSASMLRAKGANPLPIGQTRGRASRPATCPGSASRSRATETGRG